MRRRTFEEIVSAPGFRAGVEDAVLVLNLETAAWDHDDKRIRAATAKLMRRLKKLRTIEARARGKGTP